MLQGGFQNPQSTSGQSPLRKSKAGANDRKRETVIFLEMFTQEVQAAVSIRSGQSHRISSSWTQKDKQNPWPGTDAEAAQPARLRL